MNELAGPALITAGLVADIVGVYLLARGVIITPEMAERFAGTAWNKNTPLEKQFLKQSRDARIGVWIVAGGFGLQILGTWL